MTKNNSTLFLFISGLIALMLASCMSDKPQPKTALDDQPARMVSAFFGLDNGLTSLRFKGLDGMPVTFSKRVANPSTLKPELFTVITRSGHRSHPQHTTTRPAKEASKRHTVLLIGEFGSEPEDPPVRVEVTGPLILAGAENAQGLSVNVTALQNGPSLVLAYAVMPTDLPGDHPPEAKQIIVAIWDGGVTPMAGVADKNHRLGYSVAMTGGRIIHPIALGDIGGDNYEYLYLDTKDTAITVSMKSGLLMDPRSDANLATSVEVAGASALDSK